MTEKADYKLLSSIFVPRHAWENARKYVHMVRVLYGADPKGLAIAISKYDQERREVVQEDSLYLNLDPTMRNAIVRTIRLQNHVNSLHLGKRPGVTLKGRINMKDGSVLQILDKYDCHGFALRAVGALKNPITRRFTDESYTATGIMDKLRDSNFGKIMSATEFLKRLDDGLMSTPRIITCYRRSGKAVHSMIYLGHSSVFGHIIYNKAGIGLNWIYHGGFRFENIVETMYEYNCASLGMGEGDDVKVFTVEELKQAAIIK